MTERPGPDILIVEPGPATGPVHLDGAAGEGGGQILRSTLALSVVTGRPFTITGIRAGRPRPGLMRQHLTAVRAAAAVGGAGLTPTSGCGRRRQVWGGPETEHLGASAVNRAADRPPQVFTS